MDCSLTLAVFIDVLPTQAGVTYMLTLARLFWPWLFLKAAFLTIMLLPLGIYIGTKGCAGVRRVRGRVVAIGVIVCARLVVDIIVWLLTL